MSEVRGTADSEQSESEAKPVRSEETWPEQGRMGWLETECPEVHVHESRIPALVLKGAGQESESS
jgi:hypothetical protein